MKVQGDSKTVCLIASSVQSGKVGKGYGRQRESRWSATDTVELSSRKEEIQRTYRQGEGRPGSETGQDGTDTERISNETYNVKGELVARAS